MDEKLQLTEVVLDKMTRFYRQSPDGQYDDYVCLLIAEYRLVKARLAVLALYPEELFPGAFTKGN